VSSEIYENRDAGLVVPQWRWRAVFNGDFDPSVAGTFYPIMPVTSDVLVSFIKFRQREIINRAITVRVVADGQPAMEVIQDAAPNIWYYVYLSDEDDVLVTTVVQTKAGDLNTDYYSRSMSVEYMAANNGVQMEGRVRAWQL